MIRCPTCSHTMEQVLSNHSYTAWHCPRCGTLVTRHNTREDLQASVCIPKLVERCQFFGAEDHYFTPNGNIAWISLGIAELVPMRLCAQCQRPFPAHMIGPLVMDRVTMYVCPICALAKINADLAAHDCPPITEFTAGTQAAAMHAAARRYLEDHPS